MKRAQALYLVLGLAVGFMPFRAPAVGSARATGQTPIAQQQTGAANPIVPAAACVPAPSGLVGWWPFDGNTKDFYLTNDAVVYEGAAIVPGMVAQALSFDGIDDYGFATSGLNVGAGDAFTIDLWINPADLSQQRPLLEWNSNKSSDPNGGIGVHLWINVQPPFGTGNGSLYASIVDTAGNNHIISSASGILQQGVYQHVALVFNKNPAIAFLYVNANIVDSQSFGPVFTPRTDFLLHLGYRTTSLPYYYSGQMDEIEIFNRALSQSEIQAIYNAGSAGKCKTRYVINPNDSGAGSLRQTIIDSNNYGAPDTIGFNIGSGLQTISPSSALPSINHQTTIDGTTQPGFAGTPLIELDGLIAKGGNGLTCNAPVTIKGLVINRFAPPGAGISLNGGFSMIVGNYIGTDATGTVARGNGSGIVINSSFNLIGAIYDTAVTAADRNVISGNVIRGIEILPSTPPNQQNGILGNYIGTNAAGSAPLGNGIGIFVGGSSSNTIGAGSRNVISGNSQQGIVIDGASATKNSILGNYIGTNAAGNAVLGNGAAGVRLDNSASDNTIGGTFGSARNIISGNGNSSFAAGIEINSPGNFVRGNYIGTDVTGTLGFGNRSGGILVQSPNNIIGGPLAEARNIISGNSSSGILIGSSGNFVQGNYIGTDVTGTRQLGNSKEGIAIVGNGNQIGGTAPAARNVVSGNSLRGVLIIGMTQNIIQGNYIGTDAAGTAALGNGLEGVLMVEGASNNTVGLDANNVGASNTIAFNGTIGVRVDGGSRNGIRGNSIFSNGGLGIDLSPPGGVNPNDPGAHTGANNLQNFPVVTSASPSLNNNTLIHGTLNSTPNQQFFRIELFANSACDGSGNGEGQTLLGATVAQTDSLGNGSFFLLVPTASVMGSFITATATDPNGNTSEFSQCLLVTGPTPTPTPTPNVVQFSSLNYNVVEDCTTVTITVNRVGDTSGAANVNYATSDVTASERRDYITALGRLQFASGETSKSITVLINEDSYVEGIESFNVSLSNPSGTGLGAPTIATVQITDDPSEPATNVIDDPQNFVCQHYHDFLNRSPDSGGLAFWTNEITSCGANQSCIELKRINVSAAFYLSIEFQGTGYLVERIYKAAYGNANGASTFGGTHQLPVPIVRLNEFLPDTQQIGQGVVVGHTGWETVLENNKQAFTAEFVQRSRFATALPPSMTAAQFVDALNANAGNPLSQAERDQLVNSLTSGTMTRAQVLRAVAEDSDLSGAEFNRAFVLMQYFGYLRRNPNDPQDTDYTGYDFWLTKLNQFNGNFINADMVKAFITSGEYRNRFRP